MHQRPSAFPNRSAGDLESVTVARKPQKLEEPPLPEPAADRLDSWKAIAAYFDRTTRTVQIWEKREGMPVHHQHRGRPGSVYALRSELDGWWESRRTTLEAEPETLVHDRRRLAALVLAVLLFLGVLASHRLSAPISPVGADRSSLVLRRSVEPSSYRFLGRPSADGRYLSFTDDTGELALFDFVTEQTQVLTGDGSLEGSQGLAYRSTVSPDGRSVAYSWVESEGERVELRLVSLDGSEKRTLFRPQDGASIELVDWSSRGREILLGLSGRDVANRIALVSVEDGALRVVRDLGECFPLGMSLSPDDRYLAYDLPTDASNRDVYLLDLETGQDRAIVTHGAHDVYPFWARDGETLVFGSDRAGTFGVFALSMREGEPQGTPVVVRKDMGRCRPLGLTRDGAYYYQFSAGGSEVYLASLDPKSGAIEKVPTVVDERHMRAAGYSD